MAAIIGSADDAYALRKEMIETIKSINEDLRDIHTKLRVLESSFKDQGFHEVEDVVGGVASSLNNHMEGVSDLAELLQKYGDILSQAN